MYYFNSIHLTAGIIIYQCKSNSIDTTLLVVSFIRSPSRQLGLSQNDCKGNNHNKHNRKANKIKNKQTIHLSNRLLRNNNNNNSNGTSMNQKTTFRYWAIDEDNTTTREQHGVLFFGCTTTMKCIFFFNRSTHFSTTRERILRIPIAIKQRLCLCWFKVRERERERENN